MSQSDYIRHKRISNELIEQNKLSHVLNARQYTDYKEYSLENTIYSSTISYNKIIQANTPVVFGIQYNRASSCPSFVLYCGTTDTVHNPRPNRAPLTGALVRPSSMMPLFGKYDPIRKKSDITKLKYCSCVNI
jgi:hypothetical protein